MELNEFKHHLEHVILPYWNNMQDTVDGGFYGYRDQNLKIEKEAEKGTILHNRILWFYSNAYLLTPDENLLAYARHTYEFLTKYCWDSENEGMYLGVTYQGEPLETDKYIYNQAFGIYALSAYYEASKDEKALELAFRLFELIEKYGWDGDGYKESFDQNWNEIVNDELSENGLIAAKTMNTLLHVMEAYTELYRISQDEKVKEALVRSIRMFKTHVYNEKENRLEVFFDEKMNSIADLHSYGHDIEATWLLDWGCEVVGDDALTAEIHEITHAIAQNILENILEGDCLPNEKFNGVVDRTRVWWVQAETCVGFYNKYKLEGDKRYLAACERVWKYINEVIVDKRAGSEWFWSVDADGSPIPEKPITEPWKCPYHNGRMCLYMMKQNEFKTLKDSVFNKYEELITKKNTPADFCNGIYTKWNNPVLTAAHVPPFWKYDMNEETNPYFMERLGVNAAFNAGAIYLNGKYYVVARVEGNDRKSFFAVAESDNGIDGFRFWDYPILLPDTEEEETNVYDMRLTQHEDGYIYGVFCSESKDKSVNDLSAAVAAAGIVRTKNLKDWERLPNLTTLRSPQQRNVVLHPEFVDGKYAFYTRPMDDFIDTGSGSGVGFGLCEDITHAVIDEERMTSLRKYHTITEAKNGAGAVPIKTEKGWIHIAHGVRNTAAGLRYVVYVFATDLNDPTKVIAEPSGFFIAPTGIERVGDVSNVVFTNGAIVNEKNEVFIYYASSDTRLHVATTTLDKLIDYTFNTPEDPLRSVDCVKQRCELIRKNLEVMARE